MNVQQILTNTNKTLNANSPKIFTLLGIAGVISTSYLTGRASYKAALIIKSNEETDGIEPDKNERYKKAVRLTWKLYIPPVTSGIATVGCIFGLSHVTSRRATAAAAAYAISEKMFGEYRDKVEEQIGKGKSQKIRDNIAQDKVANNSNQVIYVGKGLVLCCELFTRRYFRADMESLKKAENEINQMIFSEMYVMMSEFYNLIGLPNTSMSDYVGWDSSRELELFFSTTLSEDGEPCIAFDYNYTRPLH